MDTATIKAQLQLINEERKKMDKYTTFDQGHIEKLELYERHLLAKEDQLLKKLKELENATRI